MPGAVIVANQSTGAGAGVAGQARNDLWLNKDVDLSVGTSGNTSYIWEILDKPPGSSAALSTPTLSTATFTPDIVGTYRIRLITNGGGAGNVQIRVLRVRYTNMGALANRGWVLPGLGEVGTEENNYPDNLRGYDEPLRFILEDLLPIADGVRVLLNGTLVAQQRSVNFVGTDFDVANNPDENRVDISKGSGSAGTSSGYSYVKCWPLNGFGWVGTGQDRQGVRFFSQDDSTIKGIRFAWDGHGSTVTVNIKMYDGAGTVLGNKDVTCGPGIAVYEAIFDTPVNISGGAMYYAGTRQSTPGFCAAPYDSNTIHREAIDATRPFYLTDGITIMCPSVYNYHDPPNDFLSNDSNTIIATERYHMVEPIVQTL